MTVAAPPAPVSERVYSSETFADILRRLGDIPADRVRADPQPGTATLHDLIRVNESSNGPTCELVDGTLVEKAMGFQESGLGAIVIGELYIFLTTRPVGMIVGEQAVMEILPGIVQQTRALSPSFAP